KSFDDEQAEPYVLPAGGAAIQVSDQQRPWASGGDGQRPDVQ
ncbi:MAG: hypothetical protein ACI9OJ_003139, partial [Myxococcota bacterium]